MDTQTSQVFANENKKSQDDNKETKWSKAAKVAGAAAAVAGVSGIASSVLRENENAAIVSDELQAQVENSEIQDLQDVADTQETIASADNAEHTAAHASHPVASTQPEVHETPIVTREPVHTASSEPATATFVADEQGIPVDAQWLADDVLPNETVPSASPENTELAENHVSTAELNESVPPISQSALNILTNSVGDDLADTVNVSPEIFMSMMGLKPSDMIQTQLNGDGEDHMAALLANDNGQYMLLVDSDGDGFLDTLTDITGNEYAMFGDGIHFEVSVSDMQVFVNEINPETLVDSPMYASAGAEIMSIEGEGQGEDVAYVDENDIIDAPDESELEESLETANVVIDDDLDEIDIEEDLASNDDLMSDVDDINTDLIGFDDSSLA